MARASGSQPAKRRNADKQESQMKEGGTLSAQGQQRWSTDVRAMSAYRLIAGELPEIAVSRFGP